MRWTWQGANANTEERHVDRTKGQRRFPGLVTVIQGESLSSTRHRAEATGKKCVETGHISTRKSKSFWTQKIMVAGETHEGMGTMMRIAPGPLSSCSP